MRKHTFSSEGAVGYAETAIHALIGRPNLGSVEGQPSGEGSSLTGSRELQLPAVSTTQCGAHLAACLILAVALFWTLPGQAQESGIPGGSPNLLGGITLTPASVNFGTQIVGTSSSPQLVTINNGTRLPVFIRQILADPPFMQSNNCPSVLRAGASCTANVTFVPTAGGAAAGSLTVYPLVREPVSAHLSGTGEVLTSLVISPGEAAIKFGQQLQLSATGYFADGSRQDLTGQVTWQSSDDSVITVSNDPADPGLLNTVNSGVVTVISNVKNCVSCPGGSATFGALPFTPRFAYVANVADNTLSAYTIDQDTGRMRNNGYYPIMSQPVAVAVDPYNRFLYAAGLGSNDIYGYKINAASGVLASFGSIALPQSHAVQLAIDPLLGQFLYVIESGFGIYPYTIDPKSGGLTPIGKTISAGSTPAMMTLDPSGKFAYVIDQSGQQVYSFSVDRTSGNLNTVGSPVATGNFPTSITVDVSSSFAYVTNYSSGTVSAYSIASSGALTEISGSPFTVGQTPSSILKFGDYVFVTDSEAGNVLSFKVKSDGSLAVPGLAFYAQGQAPTAEATDGSYLYVANTATNEIATFGMDLTSGNLHYWRSTRARNAPGALGLAFGTKGVVYKPKFAFWDNSNAIGAFSIDPGTGALTSVSYQPKSIGNSADSLGISVDGNFLFEPEFDGAGNRYEVSYGINPSNGALTLVNDLPISSFAYPLLRPAMFPAVVEPSGRWVYESGVLANCPFLCFMGNDQLTLESDGSLAFQSSEFAPNGLLGSVRVAEGAGRFLVSYDDWGIFVTIHGIDPGSGNLTPLSIAVIPNGYESMGYVTIDPRGRFVYANAGNSIGFGAISIFSLNPATAALTEIPGPTELQDGGPMTIDPTGRFLFMALAGNKLTQWAIDEVAGTLTSIAGDIPLQGAHISEMKVDISGRFLYLADGTSNSVYGYGIDQTSGALSPLSGSPFPATYFPNGGLALSGSVN